MLASPSMSKLDDYAAILAIGQELKSLREAAGWTQRDLSSHSGVSQSTIKEIELGREPKSTTLFKLVAALGATTDHIYQVAMDNGLKVSTGAWQSRVTPREQEASSKRGV